MLKILHTADVHLDSPLRSLALRDPALQDVVRTASRVAFQKIVQAALDHDVAALLIAGDLFDGAERSATTGAFLVEQMMRLRDAGVGVYYIKGNHDAENPVTGAVHLPDNVHVFSGRGGSVALRDDVYVHGLSFTDRQAPHSLLPRYPAPVPGAVNIALLHSSLGGTAGHDVYAPCSVAELRDMGFDYWALGHIHKRQVHSTDPWVVMPGIPQGRDIGEAGPKSATLLTLEAGHITAEEIPTSVVEFRAQTLDLSGLDGTDALRDRIRSFLGTLPVASDALVLRLTLTGAPADPWPLVRDADQWQEDIARMARSLGPLWLDKLVMDLATGAPSGNDAATELGRLMQDLQTTPGLAAEARTEVQAVLDDLPQAVRARLLPDAEALDRLTRTLSDDGAHLLRARIAAAAD